MIGNLYLWGNISGYVSSYYHYLGNENATKSNAVIIIPLSFTVQSFLNPVGAYLQKKVDPRVIMFIGCLICNGSVYLASLTKSWNLFVILYAVCFPMGVGTVYWTPIMCGWEWFPERKGLISGLVVGGFGFGAFIFGFISSAIANPDDETIPEGEEFFPYDVAMRVPKMFHLCLIFWISLSVVGSLMISRNPDYVRQETIDRR